MIDQLRQWILRVGKLLKQGTRTMSTMQQLPREEREELFDIFSFDWIVVSSSFISAIKYDANKQVLWIRFWDDAEWTYHGVDIDRVHALLEGGMFSSIGRQFHYAIKKDFVGMRMKPGTRKKS